MRHLAFLGLFGLASVGCVGNLDTPGGDDTMPPPATSVQIAVRDAAVPVANVEVIFQGADDSVIADAHTDANGLADAVVPAGGSVTVIRTYPAPIPPAQQRAPEIYTYLGVKPGDRLVQSDTKGEAPPTSAMNIIVPTGANGTVTIDTPCGSGSGTGPVVPITLRGCNPDAFYVRDGDNQSFFARVGFSENVDLSMSVLSDALSSSLSARNVLPNTSISVEKRIEAEGYVFFSSNPQRVDGTTANVDIPQLMGAEQAVIAVITDANNRSQMVSTHGAFVTGPSIVDASVGLIATIGDGTMFMPATGVTWTEATPGTPDFVLGTLSVTRSGPPLPNNTYSRAIIAPYGGMSLHVPVLPAAAAIYNPAIDDQVGVGLGLGQVTGGYDGLRATAFSVADLIDAAPMGGTMTLSYTGNPPGL